MIELHVATNGNDRWSGRLAGPNAAGTDGPLATLGGALSVVRGLRGRASRDPGIFDTVAQWTQPVTVWLHEGRYGLTEPLRFGPDDSAPVTFAAWPGDSPRIEGGIRLDAWEKATLNGETVWTMPLPDAVPSYADLRQMFVNGRRAVRARLPKTGFFRVEDPLLPDAADGRWGGPGTDRFVAAEGDIQSWQLLDEVELVALHFWVEERFGLRGYDSEKRTVICDRMSRAPLVEAWDCGGAPYYVENVLEALTEPGEWVVSKTHRRLWYRPLPDETPEATECCLPLIPQLLVIEGDPEGGRYVEWLRFDGLTFGFTSCPTPGEASVPEASRHAGDGFGRIEKHLAAASQSAPDVPGVLYLRGARHCAIENCTVAGIGWYGIEIDRGCRHVRLVGNTITDAGAGGIQVSGGAAGEPAWTETSHCRISDNHLHDLGRIFHSAAGVLVRHAWRIVITHNSVHDLYYSAISCGWRWGYDPSITREILIAHNHLYNLGKGWLSDMGGVYTLGSQPGTVIRNNLIHDIACARYGGWAIYPDEGSAHITIENNVCYRTSSSVFHQHYGRENIVRNNIFAFGGEGLVALSRREPHNSFSLYRNILLSDCGFVFLGGYGCNPREAPGFDSDMNLVWDLSGSMIAARGKTNSAGEIDGDDSALDWSAWQAAGMDRFSRWADPGFRDPGNGDFSTAPDSPVTALGFRPIDLGRIGPRPPGERDHA